MIPSQTTLLPDSPSYDGIRQRRHAGPGFPHSSATPCAAYAEGKLKLDLKLNNDHAKLVIKFTSGPEVDACQILRWLPDIHCHQRTSAAVGNIKEPELKVIHSR